MSNDIFTLLALEFQVILLVTLASRVFGPKVRVV